MHAVNESSTLIAKAYEILKAHRHESSDIDEALDLMWLALERLSKEI